MCDVELVVVCVHIVEVFIVESLNCLLLAIGRWLLAKAAKSQEPKAKVLRIYLEADVFDS
jgi:hypothetical protein